MAVDLMPDVREQHAARWLGEAFPFYLLQADVACSPLLIGQILIETLKNDYLFFFL